MWADDASKVKTSCYGDKNSRVTSSQRRARRGCFILARQAACKMPIYGDRNHHAQHSGLRHCPISLLFRHPARHRDTFLNIHFPRFYPPPLPGSPGEKRASESLSWRPERESVPFQNTLNINTMHYVMKQKPTVRAQRNTQRQRRRKKRQNKKHIMIISLTFLFFFPLTRLLQSVVPAANGTRHKRMFLCPERREYLSPRTRRCPRRKSHYEAFFRRKTRKHERGWNASLIVPGQLGRLMDS